VLRNTAKAGHASWLRPFLYAVMASLIITGLARIGYLFWLNDRVAATNGLGFILLQGLRFDLVSLGYLLVIPAALTPVLLANRKTARVWLPVLKWLLITVVGLFLFMEVATPPFISEYDVRPNYLFVEYLKYPREVFSMLFVGYKVELLAAILFVPALLWPIARGISRQISHVGQVRPLLVVPFAFGALLLCFAAARSTLDHRPVNPSTVAFSSDTLVNTLPLNSFYTVANAIYELRREDAGFPYGEADQSAAIEAVRKQMYVSGDAFTNSDIPTLRNQPATSSSPRPKNLVIIIEESLGVEFVGSMGGLPLTPNIDRFANEGIWFENLYATGTRSARGLEAIVTGFLPTTSQSVLKLSRAQKDFFTIGEFLRRRGFDTSFIYGGEAQFDNMRGFFAGNGFDTIIDKHDFTDPVFMGSWGVADEDVFNFAHEYFEARSSDKPFASVLFTTTNHTPFEFPDGRIELYEEPRATVNNAVKYADYALGQYMQMARESSYWDDTVFLIVSDHNSRVYGSEVVPIERFHIPGVIMGGSIAPQRWSRVASQIDLLPTLLSLIGVSGEHPAPGLDLTRADIDEIPGRAVMQFRTTQAYLQENQVVILRPEKSAELFDYVDSRLTPSQQGGPLLQEAADLAAWSSIAYRERQYRLPPTPDEATR
jgi:phosphoglycerol transferase MdoB-like AlkP superfamily enzyme